MASELETLRALVEHSGSRNERECGQQLATHFGRVLLPTTDTVVFVDVEYTNEVGRSDIIAIGERIGPDGKGERVAYIWELKAPQLNVFEKETESRARPSEDLCLAENQLLHYHAALSGSEMFRVKWAITQASRVEMGGVVIGRKSTFMKELGVKASAMAKAAYDCRHNSFYRPCGIRLMTWDRILEIIPILAQSHANLVAP